MYFPPKPTSLSGATAAFGLRRTISVDMSSYSSQKGMQMNSSIKRVQSSDQLDSFDHDDHQQQNDHEMTGGKNNEEEKRGAFDDIWGSILSNKKSESGSGSGSDTPYVHPLVKRTGSSLSEKSLEICTENLGSETGSDVFGSDDHTELHDPIGNINANVIEIETAKECNINYDVFNNYKRAPPTPAKTVTSTFPPPLPSLSHRMHSHRQDGRLVVEAVTVPTTTCLRALRSDGRLLLTLSSDDYPPENVRDDDRDERKELRIEFVMEEKTSCRMIMSKVIGGEWRRPRKVNAAVIKDLDGEEENIPAPEILPEIPSVNTYEYYWRSGGSYVSNVLKQLPSQVVVLGRNGNKITAQAQAQAQEEKVKEVAEYLVPFLRGSFCKEPRSLLCWEPHCIATS